MRHLPSQMSQHSEPPHHSPSSSLAVSSLSAKVGPVASLTCSKGPGKDYRLAGFMEGTSSRINLPSYIYNLDVEEGPLNQNCP